jgi:succinoglycan biosynthesis protein ExoV
MSQMTCDAVECAVRLTNRRGTTIMKVYRWASKHPNFGDDLNQFLWDFLMPEVVAEEDGAILVGVGTVLSDELPPGKPRVVIGSGAGYKPIPADIHGSDWKVYAVRGPLTSRLLGLQDNMAVVDPAVLLTRMPAFTHASGPDAIFVPHWETAHLKIWRDAAAAAGLRFVDPRQDAHFVIRQIASAKLVVAESMHAAIIADAFRVPWVPIIGTHRSLFKWTACKNPSAACAKFTIHRQVWNTRGEYQAGGKEDNCAICFAASY